MKSRRFNGIVRNGRFLLKGFKSDFFDPDFKIVAYIGINEIFAYKIEQDTGYYFVDYLDQFDKKRVYLFVFGRISNEDLVYSGGTLENLVDLVYVNVRTNRR